MTEYFKDHFETVHGIDISESMSALARERLMGTGIFFESFDGRTLPYEDGYFDVVFSYLVLQHAPRREVLRTYLKEFHRIMREGGMAKLQFRTGRGVKKWEWSYGIPLTEEEARVLLEDAGFNVRSIRTEDIKNLWVVIEK